MAGAKGGRRGKATAPAGRATSVEKAAKAAKARGGRLGPEAKALRDSLLVQRIHAQNWTWEAAAAEAGISPTVARTAVEQRRELVRVLDERSPVQLIRNVASGLEMSIGDFEAMAVGYATWSPNAAVGAKKAANDARMKLINLLQVTGLLPSDLGDLRHLMDADRIGRGMAEAVTLFLETVREHPSEARSAAESLRETFEGLIGLETPALPEG